MGSVVRYEFHFFLLTVVVSEDNITGSGKKARKKLAIL
jgi:hypothetical protein